jgi:hypothetical protein
MPYFEPPVHPTAFTPVPRLAFLKDEMETLLIGGRIESGIWRPAKDEITFDEARAIAMLKAGTLYRLTSKRLVPGLIIRSCDTDSRKSHTTELRFRSEEYMRWAVVQATFAKLRSQP